MVEEEKSSSLGSKEIDMSKRIPVYLSESDLNVLKLALEQMKAMNEFVGEVRSSLQERLESELATFEE